ncbi:MAG TPA: hypothetical protein VNO33_24105 [Kofleriaceae bacterium]|nr:hypothetical protein [Kofleriaceae bacterium]
MAFCKRARVLLLASLSLVAASPAVAQPPGLTPPGGHLPQHHAVPPLPQVYPSPLPSLPPPSRNAPVEPTIGFAIGTGRVTAIVGPDGSIDFGERRGGLWAGVDPVVGMLALIQFDTTDSAMRAAREDPYLPEKLRIMEETREERMAMRRAHDVVVMQRALDDLPRYLDAVWRQRRWSPQERRRILFALWDEAAEDGNALLREGGAHARRLIEEFIAYRIPPGSRYAFRASELTRFNRIRQSRRAFAPYRAPSRVAAPGLARAALPSASPFLAVALRSL